MKMSGWLDFSKKSCDMWWLTLPGQPVWSEFSWRAMCHTFSLRDAHHSSSLKASHLIRRPLRALNCEMFGVLLWVFLASINLLNTEIKWVGKSLWDKIFSLGFGAVPVQVNRSPADPRLRPVVYMKALLREFNKCLVFQAGSQSHCNTETMKYFVFHKKKRFVSRDVWEMSPVWGRNAGICLLFFRDHKLFNVIKKFEGSFVHLYERILLNRSFSNLFCFRCPFIFCVPNLGS